MELVPGLRVLPTPGHTQAHASLFLEKEGILIAGDLLAVEEQSLNLANPQYAFSLERCVSSLVSLRDLDVRTVLCYHGGWFHGDFASERERLIKRYSNGLENSTLLQ